MVRQRGNKVTQRRNGDHAKHGPSTLSKVTACAQLPVQLSASSTPPHRPVPYRNRLEHPLPNALPTKLKFKTEELLRRLRPVAVTAVRSDGLSSLGKKSDIRHTQCDNIL